MATQELPADLEDRGVVDAGSQHLPSDLEDRGSAHVLPADLQDRGSVSAPKTINQLNQENPPNQNVLLSSNNSSPPTEAMDYQKIIDQERAVDNVLWELPKTEYKFLEPGIATAQLGANAVAGAAARASGLTQALLDPTPSTLNEAVEGFINPEQLKDYRRAIGAPNTGRLQELLANQLTFRDKLGAFANEITPHIFLSDALPPSDVQLLTSLLEPGLGNGLAKGATKLALDTLGDPLMHTSFAAKIPPEFREIVEAPQAAEGTDKIIESYVQKAKGFGIETQRGERALLQFKAPGMNRPLIVKGQDTMQALDEMVTGLKSVGMVGKLIQETPHPVFNTQSIMYTLDNATIPAKVDNAQSLILSAGPPNEKVIRYANNFLEHGHEAGNALSKAQGIVLNPEEVAAVRQRIESWRAINENGNQAIVAAGGRDLGAIEREIPTEAQQQRMLDKLAKRYGDVPRLLIQDGNVSHDITFSGSGYDLGRTLSDEALNARNLQNAEGEIQKATRAGGFGVTADAARKRDAFSTQFMNNLYKRELGVSEAFNPNKDQVVLNSYQNKLEVASKLRFYNETKLRYGTGIDDIANKIEAAALKVQDDIRNHIAPNQEDLAMSKMSTNDWRPIEHDMWNRVDRFMDTKRYGDKDLYYPKNIADRVEQMWSSPSDNKAMQALAWVQKQKAQNMLTSPFRIGKRVATNVFDLLSNRVSMDNVGTEMAIAMGKNGDEISRLADKIPTVSNTMFDLGDYAGDIKLSSKMLTDPEVNAGVDAFYGAVHNAAKEGKLDSSLNLKDVASNMLSAPKKAVEFANGNPVSTYIRKFGNSFDGIAKRSYFRSLMQQGYPVEEAVQMVGDHMGDFSKSSPLVKNMRYVMPFASAQLKNVERLPLLLAARPGVANIVNPYDGSLKRAIESTNGWSPEDYKALKEALPYYRNPILGPILRGQQDILQGQDKAKDMLNKYVSWGLGPEAQKKLGSGLQLSLMFPSTLSHAIDTTDLSRADENMSAPVVAAAAMGLLGYDVFRHKQLDTAQTPLEGSDRIVKMLQTINPVDYPKFYNQAVMPLIQKMLPNFKQNLEEGPITRRMAQVLKIQLGDKSLQGTRLSDDTIKEMTNAKFLGLGQLTDADFSYYMHQLQLMSLMDKTDKLVGNKFTQEGKQEALRTIGAIKSLAEKANTNTKIYLDYKARKEAIGGFMDPKAEAEIGRQMHAVDDEEDLDGLQPTPVAPDLPLDREPQGVKDINHPEFQSQYKALREQGKSPNEAYSLSRSPASDINPGLNFNNVVQAQEYRALKARGLSDKDAMKLSNQYALKVLKEGKTNGSGIYNAPAGQIPIMGAHDQAQPGAVQDPRMFLEQDTLSPRELKKYGTPEDAAQGKKAIEDFLDRKLSINADIAQSAGPSRNPAGERKFDEMGVGGPGGGGAVSAGLVGAGAAAMALGGPGEMNEKSLRNMSDEQLLEAPASPAVDAELRRRYSQLMKPKAGEYDPANVKKTLDHAAELDAVDRINASKRTKRE